LIDTPTLERRGILGSTKPLKLDSLRRLAQRWDSPQALIRVCPTLFALLQVLFRFEADSLQNAVRPVPVNLLSTFGSLQTASNLEQQVEPHRFSCQGSALYLSATRFLKWLITLSTDSNVRQNREVFCEDF